MTSTSRLEAVAAPVLRDVAVTTGLQLDVSPWHGRDATIAFAVHEAGVVPARPVWEAFQVVSGRADSIALHPLPPERRHEPGVGDSDELEIAITQQVQVLTQVLLWKAQRDPTWPECAAHPGVHPLQVVHRGVARQMGGEQPFVLDVGALWICPHGEARVRVGQLEPPNRDSDTVVT